MHGSFIVVEGSDASGKHTQAKLLAEKLKSNGFSIKKIAFPRYDKFFGKLVRRYLVGGFGSIEEISPEIPSMLYALDRYDAAKEIEDALSNGKIVVCDRFTASNIAHQAAKFPKEKQQEFIKWVEAVESRLPSPSLTIYLDVPVSFSQKLMEKQGRKKDLHEKNVSYLQSVRNVYLELAKRKNWFKVDCVKENKLLSIEEIHSIVWEKVKQIL